jgi:hypothetical protein
MGACGNDDESSSGASSQDRTPTQASRSPAQGTLPNACPTSGCKARIVSVSRAGRELRVTFKANFTPDVVRNHFHVYWDTYTSKQVSADAVGRFGVEVGAWAPTADNPFTTGAVVSVSTHKKSRALCVTAGDRYHNVLDPDSFSCRDVSKLL